MAARDLGNSSGVETGAHACSLAPSGPNTPDASKALWRPARCIVSSSHPRDHGLVPAGVEERVMISDPPESCAVQPLSRVYRGEGRYAICSF